MLPAYFNMTFEMVYELIETVAESIEVDASRYWCPSKMKVARIDVVRLNPAMLPILRAFCKNSLYKLAIISRQNLIFKNHLFLSRRWLLDLLNDKVIYFGLPNDCIANK